MARVELLYPAGSLVVVAGLPGAGKTTLLRRVADPAEVLDTDDLRAAGRRGRLALYTRHYARLAKALATGRGVIVHLRASRRWLRRVLAAFGRGAHLVVLAVEPREAVAGQRARGRRVGPAEMSAEIRRWDGVDEAQLRGEGWASVTVLDREHADAVARLGHTA